MRALYRFNISIGDGVNLSNLWQRASNIAEDEDHYEQQSGGEPWPKWRLALVGFKKDKKGYTCMFEVHAKV